jgi:hypothetical protein
MAAKQTIFILPFILSMALFSQGAMAQAVPPPVDGAPPADNTIVCDLLLEDTTDPLTEAIGADQVALFGTGGRGSARDVPFADVSLAFRVEAYTLLTDSMYDLDRSGESLVDMSVAECISSASALEMVDKIHLARGKKGYLLANLEFVDAVVYAGLLKRVIGLEKEVLQTLIGPPVAPASSTSDAPATPTSTTTSTTTTTTPASTTTTTPTSTATPTTPTAP